MTRQRALILDIMREKCPEHMTADEIFSHARQAMPHIARGTVYRNLKLMELDGEIGHLEMPDGPDRYDANPSPHGHLLCESCGDLADLPVVGLIRDIESAIGTEVRGYTLGIATTNQQSGQGGRAFIKSPTPRTRQVPPSSANGTSAPMPAPMAHSSLMESRALYSSFKPTSTPAASALPPAMPARTGTRL